jgi:nitrogen fixation NifU-like protein
LSDEDLAVTLENAGDYDHCAGHARWKKINEGTDSLYSERLLAHFRNPRRAGEMAAPTAVVVVENPACGDRLRLSVKVEGGVVADAAFQVKGCTASIACGSALADWMAGRRVEELRGMTAVEIAEAVEGEVDGLPQASKHAGVLCADGVRALVRQLG